MSRVGLTDDAGRMERPATVMVWDPFVRLFHWTLVAGVAIAFATGDEAERVHIWVGYTIAALLACRIVWGFVGPRRARFADFARPPSETLRYIGQSVRGKAPRVLGHNPAGGVKILALFGLIALISATGYLLTTDSYWGSEGLKEFHEASAYALLALVLAHVTGVVWTSFEHGENLFRAMIIGRKRR